MEAIEPDGELVLYEQEGVLLATKGISGDSTNNLFLGRLRITKEKSGTFMAWVGEDGHATQLTGAQESDWTVIDPGQGYVGYHSNSNGSGTKSAVRPIKFEVQDLKCIRLSSIADSEQVKTNKHSGGADPARTCSVTFVQTDGTTYPQLIFPGGSTSNLLEALKPHLELKRSCQDDSMILCETRQPKSKKDPYERTLADLRLFPDRNPGFPGPGLPQLSYINLGQLGQIGVGAWRFVNDLKRDPYSATMTAFSKISDYLLHEDERPEEIAELLQKSFNLDESPHDRPPANDKDADDSAALASSSDSSVEGYELIQPPVADLIPRPKTVRNQPMGEEEWRSYFDEEGRISSANVAQIKLHVFSGGVDPSLRIEVWKFLLGYYPWAMTHTERKEHRDRQVEEYYRMKLQWRSLSAEQESRFAAFKQRKDLIDKDVNRTDRTIPFFAGENNPNVATLRDVLMTYLMYDFDLGYVQGMSDLLAPILFVVENEVDAFWCFVAYMERVNLNFELDQSGIKRQLGQLRTLLHATDPHLASYLDTRDSGNLFFCFRWLLVLFKREFNYPAILRLWEVLWTDGPFWRRNAEDQWRPSVNFHLVLALSILDGQRSTILENRFGFTEILKHVNDLALYIDLEENMTKAEGIFVQIKDSPSVGQEVRRILGIDNDDAAKPEDAVQSKSSPDSVREDQYETSLNLHYL